MFPNFFEFTLSYHDSDHRLLLLRKKELIDGGSKPFRFHPYWFEEEKLMESLKGWWEECNVKGNAGFVFHSRLKHLKLKIKAWVKANLSKVEDKICYLEGVLATFDSEEEERFLSDAEQTKKIR